MKMKKLGGKRGGGKIPGPIAAPSGIVDGMPSNPGSGGRAPKAARASKAGMRAKMGY